MPVEDSRNEEAGGAGGEGSGGKKKLGVEKLGTDKLGVAVSGGPDSLALLLLAAAAYPDRVEAATVDHGLRPESAGEAQFVAQLCAALDIPHAICPVEVPPGNVQSKARDARYNALTHWATQRSVNTVLTAHHADDQAETIIMRLNRGSGLAGLCGIRAMALMPDKDTGLARPLLGWRKAELMSVIRSAGVTPVDDPSNHSDDYDRVRVRKALANADWLDAKALAQSAKHLAEAERAVQMMCLQETARCVTTTAEKSIYTPAGPPFIRKRVAEALIARFAGGEPRGSQVAALVERLERGENGNLAGVMATVKQGRWEFRPEPSRNTG